MKQTTLYKLFHTEYDPWPDELTVSISQLFEDQIESARYLARSSEIIRQCELEAPDSFLDGRIWQSLYEQCPFGIAYLNVHEHGFVFCLQAKHDSSVQAEYEPWITSEEEDRR